MSPATRPRRWFRPQISLRALLLLMMLAGVGLTVYRWPWVETIQRETIDLLTLSLQLQYLEPGADAKLLPLREDNPLPPYVEKTTFRRNWRGEKMKHGLTQKFSNGQLWCEQYFYEGERHGAERALNQEGQVTRE